MHAIRPYTGAADTKTQRHTPTTPPLPDTLGAGCEWWRRVRAERMASRRPGGAGGSAPPKSTEMVNPAGVAALPPPGGKSKPKAGGSTMRSGGRRATTTQFDSAEAKFTQEARERMMKDTKRRWVVWGVGVGGVCWLRVGVSGRVRVLRVWAGQWVG